LRGERKDGAIPEGRFERIIDEKFSLEQFSCADDELQHFCCLERTDHSRNNTEETDSLWGRKNTGRRGFFEQTSVARAFTGHNDRQLTFKFEYGSGDERFLRHDTGVIHKEPCRIIVAAIDNKIIILYKIEDVVFRKPFFDGNYVDVRVQGFKGTLCRFDLWFPDRPGVVGDLTLEIAEIYFIIVNNGDSSDPGSSEVIADRGTKSSGAYDEDPCFQQLYLTQFSNLRKDNVSAVSLELVFRKFHGFLFPPRPGILTPTQPPLK
jgi:hypothetical protein